MLYVHSCSRPSITVLCVMHLPYAPTTAVVPIHVLIPTPRLSFRDSFPTPAKRPSLWDPSKLRDDCHNRSLTHGHGSSANWMTERSSVTLRHHLPPTIVPESLSSHMNKPMQQPAGQRIGQTHRCSPAGQASSDARLILYPSYCVRLHGLQRRRTSVPRPLLPDPASPSKRARPKLYSPITTSKRQYGLILTSYLAVRSLHQAAATAISNHDFSVTLPKAKFIAFATHLLPCRLLPETVHFNQFYNETPASHSPTPHVLPMNKKDCRQTAINAPSGGPLFRCFRASQDHFASPLPGHPCTSYRSCVTMHTKNSPYLEGEAASATSFLSSVGTPLTRIDTLGIINVDIKTIITGQVKLLYSQRVYSSRSNSLRMAKKADVAFVGFTYPSPEYLIPQGLPSLLDDSRAATTTGRSTTFLGLDLNSSVGITCLQACFIDKSKHRPEDALLHPPWSLKISVAPRVKTPAQGSQLSFVSEVYLIPVWTMLPSEQLSGHPIPSFGNHHSGAQARKLKRRRHKVVPLNKWLSRGSRETASSEQKSEANAPSHGAWTRPRMGRAGNKMVFVLVCCTGPLVLFPRYGYAQ
ncbi:uncharacterized protein CLUP02_05284 [Colletotrichum lupini]|uniref:Uncharacterized protein n=1 Tax=Colletotrichum lupini TaxID=145971 RepID=A0A9Q8SLW1_9PEZI|nr:uncharacterized protein CLUP02_05284 [Colletotrichum lupini]UQC79804.1 hypothetical protein CLUP02_05284 [Colletotrichum lupini]